MTMDISDFYLSTKSMKQPELMHVPLKSILQVIINQYSLLAIAHNGYVYIQINGGMYSLPQAGCLANNELIPCLAKAGYIQTKHTPGLFTHHANFPIKFCLVLDGFIVSYIGKENTPHLSSIH
jgi:hypothetical protein